MCGRFYIDDETAREIEKIARKIDRKNAKNGGRISFGACPGFAGRPRQYGGRGA